MAVGMQTHRQEYGEAVESAAAGFASVKSKKQIGKEGEAVEEARAEREREEAGLIGEISEMRLKPGNDIEALTTLYRKIFNFLVVRAGLELGADRPAEREIAAALESVFPRIGLKAFTALPHDDKVAQLHELANIVLGIRLFNREIGKGGAGLPTVEEDVYQAVLELKEAIEVSQSVGRSVGGTSRFLRR